LQNGSLKRANSSNSMVPFTSLQLDRDSGVPLQRQLYNEIRAAILGGRLSRGARLPSTRSLACDLGLSRNTIAGAFDQLLAEGYIEGKVGSGTYVMGAAFLPRSPRAATRVSPHARPSARGRQLAATAVSPAHISNDPIAFRPGIPALNEFPREQWARIAGRLIRHAPPRLLNYNHPAGYFPLRTAIADYLRAARGVRCTPEQVIVTAGSQQAIDLAARVLLDPGEVTWLENPGYLGARGAFQAAGIVCAPVPVDSEGLSVAQAERLAPDARMAYVSPSHQYPLGVTMSLGRRLELLDWARRRGAWIIEDDYDSEFRYTGRLLESLQGLDSTGRVLYTGSFSKVLFPAIRLGYLVAPEELTAAFVAARSLADRHSPVLDQAVTAEFLMEGHFARHVRRMRALYRERQEALLAACRRDLRACLEVHPSPAGMHLVGWLPRHRSDRAVSRAAMRAGVAAPAISDYACDGFDRPGLILGYAAVNSEQIREGTRNLANAMLNLRTCPRMKLEPTVGNAS
jgi:GntR family transcriptional regulator/MocR family aminotransferase